MEIKETKLIEIAKFIVEHGDELRKKYKRYKFPVKNYLEVEILEVILN